MSKKKKHTLIPEGPEISRVVRFNKGMNMKNAGNNAIRVLAGAVSDGIKGFAIGGGMAVVTGAAIVPKTILFGLVTTGTVVAMPVVMTWAAAGAAIMGGTSIVSRVARNMKTNREFRKMLEK